MTNQEAIDILTRHNAWRWDNEGDAIDTAIKAIGDLEAAVILLRTLADLQNGPPLWEESEEWEVVIKKIYKFLKEME